MDAHDQLLLSEGVCSQLGIVEYHDNVWPGHEPETVIKTGETGNVLDTSNVSQTATVPIVRTFHVRLLKSVTFPANKAVTVPVYISEHELPTDTLMLFEGHDYVPEISTPCTLLNTVNAMIEVCNDRGFTEKIPVVGEATEVQVVEPVNDEVPRDEMLVRTVTTDQQCEQRQQKLTETVEA